jgi:hypothetical protein
MNLVRWVPTSSEGELLPTHEDSSDQQRGDQQPGTNRPKVATETGRGEFGSFPTVNVIAERRTALEARTQGT